MGVRKQEALSTLDFYNGLSTFSYAASAIRHLQLLTMTLLCKDGLCASLAPPFPLMHNCILTAEQQVQCCMCAGAQLPAQLLPRAIVVPPPLCLALHTHVFWIRQIG